MIGSSNYRGRAGRGRPLPFSRYDLVLAVIPLAFLLGVVTSNVLSVSLESGIAVGSTVGLLAVTDALFLNPPGRNGDAD